MLDDILPQLWTQLNGANLHGIPLLLAMLMCFFAGVLFTVRRLRMDARAFWNLILRGTSAQNESATSEPAATTPANPPE